MTGRLRRAGQAVFRTDFARFAATGAVGFGVDAAVLLAVIASGWAGPIAARLISFACALWATFEINRRWSFEGAAPRPYGALLASYVAVQGAGFACNLGVYAAAHLLLPHPLDAPLACLALGSGVALLLNFAGLRRLVFRRDVP